VSDYEDRKMHARMWMYVCMCACTCERCNENITKSMNVYPPRMRCPHGINQSEFPTQPRFLQSRFALRAARQYTRIIDALSVESVPKANTLRFRNSLQWSIRPLANSRHLISRSRDNRREAQREKEREREETMSTHAPGISWTRRAIASSERLA
jgi:hypothetical protein